jgi:hypothetical protein
MPGGGAVSRPRPLPHLTAWRAVARCVARTAGMLVRREVHLPRRHVGRVLRFADGSEARVYRETVIGRPPPQRPCVLVVRFRLRAVRDRGHAAFERESLLNTPLFVGFPGLVSKLWLAHDGDGTYRGVYEWDGPDLAENYARALWRVLALVSERGSIDYRILSGLRRDDVLTEPARLAGRLEQEGDPWWRVVAVT